MGVTIKDIAAKANVSTTTVSRVINNKPDVSDKTKAKIQKIITQNNYQPNDIARGLVLKKTKTIGLIIPDISNPFFPEIIKGVEHKTKDFGYSVIICDTDNQIKQEKSSIDLLLSKQVDGIIMSLSNDSLMDLDAIKESNLSIVQLDRNIPDLNYPMVSVDNKVSGYKATKYLIDLGHKKIGHVTGELHTKTAQDRMEGYKKALNDNNLEINEILIINGDYSKKSGYQAMKKMINNQTPTAVFFANDLMALGAYEALDEYNLKIPDDISIIGHDDIDVSSLIQPKLTTMSQPKNKLGKIAAEILLDLIENNKDFSEDVILNTKLVKRQSAKKLDK
jgi:LacI family transcriptional regulator